MYFPQSIFLTPILYYWIIIITLELRDNFIAPFATGAGTTKEYFHINLHTDEHEYRGKSAHWQCNHLQRQ
jgi:hypothetical protein